MLSRAALFKITLICLLGLVLTAPGWLVIPALASDTDDLLTLVNQERTSRSLAPLVLCERLTIAAQLHTDDMIARHFFNHTNPDGKDPFERMHAIGYNYTWAGENIAVGQSTPADVMNSWMNSQGHRDNILSPNFTHIGIGIAVGDYTSGGHTYHNMKYWTQTFGAGGQCNPSPPTLIAPTGAISGLQPMFSWSSTGGAVTYEFQIGTTNPPTTPSISVTKNNYTPSSPMLPGLYYWRVRAYSSLGTPFTNWSSGSFTLNSPADAAPPRAYFSAQTPLLTWAAVTGAQQYDLEVYSVAALTPASQVFSTTTSSLSASIPGLDGGIYYWRVRARSTATTGAWSPTDTFAYKP